MSVGNERETSARVSGRQEPSESIEIELKFEVSTDTATPSAEAFAAAGFELGETETHHLHATYFDTDEAGLAQQRVAVRVREGGPDAGWHLKLKGDEGTREFQWPPSPEMPDALRDQLRERIGDAPVRPIAELRTQRRVTAIRSGEVQVAELMDDRVFATEIRADERVDRAWREWEAELAPGADRAALERVAEVLVAAGGEPSPSSAKIARATGSLTALAHARGASEDTIARLQEMDRSDREAARRLKA